MMLKPFLLTIALLTGALGFSSSIQAAESVSLLTLLGARGRALLASLGKDPTPAGAAAARNAVRAGLGLPPRSGPHSLWPASAYTEIAEAAGFGDGALLTEDVERHEAPAAWSARGRTAFAVLSRFQLAGAAALPTGRALKPRRSPASGPRSSGASATSKRTRGGS